MSKKGRRDRDGWNARMLASFLQAFQGEVGVGGWGGGCITCLLDWLWDWRCGQALSVTFQRAVGVAVDFRVNGKGPTLSLRTGWLSSELTPKPLHAIALRLGLGGAHPPWPRDSGA